MLGGPGLLVGAGVGAAVPRWRVLAFLTLLVGLTLFYVATHVDFNAGDEEDRSLLFVLAMFTNFVGWIVGLAAGVIVSVLRRQP